MKAMPKGKEKLDAKTEIIRLQMEKQARAKAESFFKFIDALVETEGFKKLCAEMRIDEYMIKLTPEELKESTHLALALFYAFGGKL